MTTSNTRTIRIARGHARNITVTNSGKLFDATVGRREHLVGITVGYADRGATIKLLDRADFDIEVGAEWNRRPAPVGRKVGVAANGFYALGNTGARIELKAAGDELFVTFHGAEQRLAA
jgi:hypothetical protein